MQKIIKLATRSTTLALTQAEIVKKAINNIDPTVTVEFVQIKTSGDIDTSSPITNHTNFFTKEVDECVIQGNADASVHSLKDTSINRPIGLTQVALLTRDDPRDVLITSHKTYNEINLIGRSFVIGTSSPRREQIVPEFLNSVLPLKNGVSTKIIRGKVETRLAKLLDKANGYDAIVLSIAGIDRLISYGKIDRQRFLQTYKLMFLPLMQVPSAPGQGTIVVECKKDSKWHNMLSQIDCKQTRHDVTTERNILAQFGGGCHQKFGVSSYKRYGYDIIVTKGVDKSGNDISSIKRNIPQINHENFIDPQDLKIFYTEQIEAELPENVKTVFVSHANAVNNQKIIDFLKSKDVWASGISTFTKLAKMGVFVTGCFEGFGIDFARKISPNKGLGDITNAESTNQSNIIKITNKFSAEEAPTANLDIKAIATYEIKLKPLNKDQIDKILNAKVIMWRSYVYYKHLSQFVGKDAIHLCIKGETYKKLANESFLKDKLICFDSFECYKVWRASIGLATEG